MHSCWLLQLQWNAKLLKIGCHLAVLLGVIGQIFCFQRTWLAPYVITSSLFAVLLFLLMVKHTIAGFYQPHGHILQKGPIRHNAMWYVTGFSSEHIAAVYQTQVFHHWWSLVFFFFFRLCLQAPYFSFYCLVFYESDIFIVAWAQVIGVALTKFEVALCLMATIPLLLPLLHLDRGASHSTRGPRRVVAVPL